MSPRLRRVFCALALALAGAALSDAATAASRTLTIEAGPHARVQVAIPFDWPFDAPAGTARREDGRRLPIQVIGNQAWILERDLAPGAVRTYRLNPRSRPARSSSGPTADAGPEAVRLAFRSHPVATYVQGPGSLPRADIPERYRRAGYLHPLQTPTGIVVTGDYPTNHIHHHGVWTSWTRTAWDGRKPDFWNMGQGSGRVDFVALDDVFRGAVVSGFRSRHDYVDLSGPVRAVALHESWAVRVLPTPAGARYHLLDLEVAQRCATDRALSLPKYHYGGFAYRGLPEWDGADGMLYLDSNGVTNRVAANESRVRWCWLGGRVLRGDRGTTLAGVAFLAHPRNFRAPEPVRVHPTEPYFCFAPSQLGDWSIEPGTEHRMAYRMVVLDGAPDAIVLDRLWNDFAHPPTVRVN